VAEIPHLQREDGRDEGPFPIPRQNRHSSCIHVDAAEPYRSVRIDTTV
jgi:hypothetical protein